MTIEQNIKKAKESENQRILNYKLKKNKNWLNNNERKGKYYTHLIFI